MALLPEGRDLAGEEGNDKSWSESEFHLLGEVGSGSLKEDI